MRPQRLAEKLTALIGNQSELSRKTGIPQSAISQMASGRRRPYLDQAFALARAMGVPLEYLADDAMDTPPVVEISEDERFLVGLIRDMGIDRATAVKRLTESPTVTSSSPSYGDRKASEKPRKGRGDIA